VEDERKKQLGSAPTTPAPPSPVPSPDLAAGSGPDSTLDMPAVDAATTTDLPAALGRFRVRKKLGEGGMGVVLDCVDADLGRRVAIKLVRTEADVPAYRARLLREAQAMARLEHPNVVRVYEVGSERGRLFIAMEYVDGVTLSAWLREPRPWPEVVEMFVQVGAGLSAVHGVGLVHRWDPQRRCGPVAGVDERRDEDRQLSACRAGDRGAGVDHRHCGCVAGASLPAAGAEL